MQSKSFAVPIDNSAISIGICFNFLAQSQDRIMRLKQKIEGIQVSIEREKAIQEEQVNSQFETLEDQINQTIDTRSSIIGSLTSEVILKINPRYHSLNEQ